jgi:hypothetical protein
VTLALADGAGEAIAVGLSMDETRSATTTGRRRQ